MLHAVGMGDIMKLALALIASLATTACVGVKFYKSDKSGAIDTSTEVGLPFHESKPYLLVTRSGAKDGGVDSKIIYLPDLTTTYYAKPDPVLIGSSQFTLTLTDGRLAAFNGQVTADLPGLLADLVSPVKGLAEADAARAAGDLDRASAEQIRASLAKNGGGADGFVENKNTPGSLLATSVNPCNATPPDPIPAHNRQLSDDQAKAIILAVLDLACAHVDAPPSGKALIADSVGSVLLVYDADFPSSAVAVSLALGGKHPTAQAFRAIATVLKGFDISAGEKPTDAEQRIESIVKKASEALASVADQIDPQSPKVSAPAYDLYEILMERDTLGKVTTTLRKIEPPTPPK